MFGDNTGNTEFTAVDMDLRSNVIVGGYSRSTTICGSGCSVPIVMSLKQMGKKVVSYESVYSSYWEKEEFKFQTLKFKLTFILCVCSLD